MSFSFGEILGLSSGSSALSYYGQHRENEQNRSFMRSMSSSAHQREVADLKAAGLNPILSATGGSGASTPSSSSTMPGVPDLGSSAMQYKRLNQELNTMQQQEHAYREQGYKSRQEADESYQRTVGQELQNKLLDALIPSAKAKKEFDESPAGEKLRYLERVMDALRGSKIPYLTK